MSLRPHAGWKSELRRLIFSAFPIIFTPGQWMGLQPFLPGTYKNKFIFGPLVGAAPVPTVRPMLWSVNIITYHEVNVLNLVDFFQITSRKSPRPPALHPHPCIRLSICIYMSKQMRQCSPCEPKYLVVAHAEAESIAIAWWIFLAYMCA